MCYFTAVINSVISTGWGYRLLQCRVWSPDRISLLSDHLHCACSACFFHAPALKEIPKAKKSYVKAYQILLHFTLLHCTDGVCFTNRRQGPPPAKKITACFIAILALWQWSGANLAISLRYVCNGLSKRLNWCFDFRKVHGNFLLEGTSSMP